VPVNPPPSRRSWSRARSSATRKGSFTGAIRQQLGKFELASGGTLVSRRGGRPANRAAGKLLRANPGVRIERVAGRTLSRPVPADRGHQRPTSRRPQGGELREDLYYRLNVIPIRMPALRDRIEISRSLRGSSSAGTTRSPHQEHPGDCRFDPAHPRVHWWPATIRELENLIERIVAVSGQGLDHGRRPSLRATARRPARCPGCPRRRTCSSGPSRPSSELPDPGRREKSGWNVTATAGRSHPALT